MKFCYAFIVMVILGLMLPAQGEPKTLEWNRYVTKNFEILSLDNAQGRYLCDNVEFIKTWTLWRWGMKDSDFPQRCKLICIPSSDLYEKLFYIKNSTWRVSVKDGVPEYVIWFVSDGQKWNIHLPVLLTGILLYNLELSNHSQLPFWCHRGMSVLNGRIEDIKSYLSVIGYFNSKYLFNTTLQSYNMLDSSQKSRFDAQAACFCLWIKQELGGKAFLDFVDFYMRNPGNSLKNLGFNDYSNCDLTINSYATKLAQGSKYYFTW